MPSRRTAATGVFAVAAVVLAAGAATVGRTVGGHAQAAPVPPAAAVGDCLWATTEAAAYRVDDNGLRLSSRSFGACGEPTTTSRSAPVVVGEVAAVLTERSGRPDDECAEPVGRYLGNRGVPSRSSGDLWHPSGGTTVIVGNPDTRQWADGQRWQACVVLPPMVTVDGAFAPAHVASSAFRSARGAWADPGYRDRLGDCFIESAGPIARLPGPVFCGAPHDGERLGVASWTVDVPSTALLRQTCADMAAQQLGTSDPTRGGVLTVEVVVVADPTGTRTPVADTDTLTARAEADCTIRPVDTGQRLTATLLGVEDGPLPLARR